jgi:hypothetical protein
MSGRINAAAVLWNEDPDRLVFLLEEFCVEMKESGLANPVVVDCRKGANPPHFHLVDNREAGIRGLKGMARGSIPFLTPDTVSLLKKGDIPVENYLYLLLADEEVLETVYQGMDDILFMAQSSPETVSMLYRFIQKYKHHPARYPRFHIMITGENRIEVAADAFVSFRDEIKKLSRNQVDINFTGCCAIDFEKIDIVRAQRAPYRDIFKGDSFFGQLQYCGRNFGGKVEKVEFDGSIEQFFRRFEENP